MGNFKEGSSPFLRTLKANFIKASFSLPVLIQEYNGALNTGPNNSVNAQNSRQLFALHKN